MSTNTHTATATDPAPAARDYAAAAELRQLAERAALLSYGQPEQRDQYQGADD